MFSQNYTVIDKHSLVEEKYISTLHKMPWIYTSLADDQYLPILDTEVSDKLRLFFKFKFPTRNAEPLYDSRKIFIIEENNGEIISFDCRNEIRYYSLINDKLNWRYFRRSLNLEEELLEIQPKIDKLTGVTDAHVTKIVGIQYNSDASFKSIGIFDSSYDLNEYSNNQILSKLNSLCSDNVEICKGVVCLLKDSSDVIFKFVLNYPKKLLNGKLSDRVLNYREHYIKMFSENQLITEKQETYIRSLLVGRTQFELQFLVSEAGEVKDIFLYHYKIKQFEDLTAD